MTEVIDISPNGQVTVIDGPRTFLSTDPSEAAPIAESRVIPATGQHSTLWRAPPNAVRTALRAAAEAQQLDEPLVEAVAWQESRFRSDAVSPRGALGVMQLMPGTARALGVNPADLQANAHGGAAYLRLLLSRYDGDVVKALAAYNAGPGRVDFYHGVPPFPETRAYVAAILNRLAAQADGPATLELGSDR